jgi:hypothetical protein
MSRLGEATDMRGIGNHNPPPEDTQPRPEDNTSEYVMRQVARSTDKTIGKLIHTESAREIAAWYQSPRGYGADFERFAGAGEITSGLVEAIEREIATVSGDEWTPRVENEAALRALLAYVRACPATVYIVGVNTPGCLPDGDVGYFWALPEAVVRLGELVGDWATNADEAEGSGKGWTPVEAAEHASELQDEADDRHALLCDDITHYGGTTVHYGTLAFWVHRETMLCGAVVDAQKG